MNTFEAALTHVKAGGMAYRTGWNGTGMDIRMYNPYTDQNGPTCLLANKPFLYLVKIHEDQDPPTEDRIPWVPSQGDLMATDWVLA